MRIRRLANQLWGGLGDQRLALVALVLLSITQIAAFILPQIPVSSDQSVLFNRWLAEFRPRLGEAARPLAALGLLTIRASYLLRAILAFFGLLVAANLDRLREIRRARTPMPRQIGRILICIGGLLIIGGWAGQMSAGWRDPEVIAWPGAEIAVPDHNLSLPQPSGPLGVWRGGYGYYVISRGQRIGLEIQAADAAGDSLPLLPAVGEAPQPSLRLAFTTAEPEAFFAIQEAGLIFRLNQIADTIQVQAYRSASGELLTEVQLDGNATSTLQLDGTKVTIVPTLLPRYEVIYNPGAALEGGGMALFAVGAVLGTIAQRSAARETNLLDEASEQHETTG